MDNKILAIATIGFVVGVFIESFLGFGFAFGGLMIIFAGALFLISGIGVEFKGQSALVLLLLAASIGVFRMAFTAPNDFPLDGRLGEKMTVEGVIYEEPDTRENSVNLKVKFKSEDLKSNILVRTGLFPTFSYGDLVKVSGTLNKPKKFETAGGGEFDYPSYLAKDKIY